MAKSAKLEHTPHSKIFTYDRWMETIGIPIHKGYYIEDLRTVELGWWEERQCNSAFIQLMGQEGVSSARVTEIAPGKTLTSGSPSLVGVELIPGPHIREKITVPVDTSPPGSTGIRDLNHLGLRIIFGFFFEHLVRILRGIGVVKEKFRVPHGRHCQRQVTVM